MRLSIFHLFAEFSAEIFRENVPGDSHKKLIMHLSFVRPQSRKSARLAELNIVHDNTRGRREDGPLLRVSRLCDRQTETLHRRVLSCIHHAVRLRKLKKMWYSQVCWRDRSFDQAVIFPADFKRQSLKESSDKLEMTYALPLPLHLPTPATENRSFTKHNPLHVEHIWAVFEILGAWELSSALAHHRHNRHVIIKVWSAKLNILPHYRRVWRDC